MSSLAAKTCVPCRGGVPPLKGKELEQILKQVPQWAHWNVVNEHHITRAFTFPDFKQALAFVNKVGDLADFINERQRLLEVWKRERSGNVVLVDYIPVSPLRHLLKDLFEFFSLERRYAPAAGNTGLGG